MDRRNQQGFAILVRSTRERRPASVRDVFSIASGVAQAAGPLERMTEKLDWYRVPVAESGHEVLVRSQLGGPRVNEDVGNEVTDRATALNSAWTTLKGDFATARTAGVITAEFQGAFLRDWDAWVRFYREHSGDWVALRTTLGEIETRRQLLERWRTALIAAGGTTTGQPTQAPEPGLLTPGASIIPDLAGTAGGISAAIAVAAVAAVVGLVVLEAGAIRRRVS